MKSLQTAKTYLFSKDNEVQTQKSMKNE